MPRARSALVVLLLVVLWGSGPARAHEDAWKNALLVEILALQSQPACFEPKQFASLYVLGVKPGHDLLEPAEEREIVEAVGEAIRPYFRHASFNSAANFELLTGLSQDYGEGAWRPLRDLVQRVSNADLTLVLVPSRRSGRTLNARAVLIVRDSGALNCTPSVALTLPIPQVSAGRGRDGCSGTLTPAALPLTVREGGRVCAPTGEFADVLQVRRNAMIYRLNGGERRRCNAGEVCRLGSGPVFRVRVRPDRGTVDFVR